MQSLGCGGCFIKLEIGNIAKIVLRRYHVIEMTEEIINMANNYGCVDTG